MTYNSDDLNQLKTFWKTVETELVELQLPIPSKPQFPPGAVPIPISSTARQKAERMASLCRNSDRRETMRRNLLATIAVHDYLRLQGYLPDLEASDCWNPILGRTGEVADLVVSQIGRLECCAMKPGQLTCPVPSEGQFGRSGYVAVEMDEEGRWGWLLGFIPSRDEVNPIEILSRKELYSIDEFGVKFAPNAVAESPLNQLKPITDFPEALNQLQQPSKNTVNLRQWLNNYIEEGWQKLETLFSPEELTPAFIMRSSLIERGKQICLATQVIKQSIILIVKLNPQSEKDTNIIVEVRPQSGQLYLPNMLQVKILNENQTAVMQATTSSTNRNIRFDFNAEPEERFSIQMILGETSVIEDFEI
ncbi:DUF1822 family protein [Aliterella atlantica]|uniref:DUF1822 domain-containing protein n=1 Tax=Aliterella atlantica CENA595 TaxID=1618023 RepID=A0A0D8ZM03_9CYAN|nr:DUF1822 family protein [Aliterella atlantica]KJH69760.1 hypothetical protein UH38_21815 [Aliterella atlantica CENA595]